MPLIMQYFIVLKFLRL